MDVSITAWLEDGSHKYIINHGLVGNIGTSSKAEDIPEVVKDAHRMMSSGELEQAINHLQNAGFQVEQVNWWKDGVLGKEASWMEKPPSGY
ncbi:MAG: hypothetical protein HXX08_17410 [Chloroflexi bacterium]|uniref:Uncharacterized protein n=1 Tax=Candidatus Chlorohelix allophototropha TaxID=3003348 RepID=A0A8T7M6A1_9CHLR|nr:hypothetical protein [Chloroflexota bacterium]WJW69547.1 hypothetical protein OZ401_003166 [Chloroflexota bacterium L227-S17]